MLEDLKLARLVGPLARLGVERLEDLDVVENGELEAAGDLLVQRRKLRRAMRSSRRAAPRLLRPRTLVGKLRSTFPSPRSWRVAQRH